MQELIKQYVKTRIFEVIIIYTNSTQLNWVNILICYI